MFWTVEVIERTFRLILQERLDQLKYKPAVALISLPWAYTRLVAMSEMTAKNGCHAGLSSAFFRFLAKPRS